MFGRPKIKHHTSCATVDIKRRFYYNPPKPDLGYFNRTGYWVPNIVHFIWYSNSPKPFRFHNMLSVMSAHRYIQPEVIFFHTNMEPTGEYWERVLSLPSFHVIYREYTLCFNDNFLKAPAHKEAPSNVDRMRVLSDTGGIYFDLDVIAVRSFDALRRFPCTVGLEKTANPKVCGATIVCSSQSLFLHLWRQNFVEDYRTKTWAYNTGIVPTELWKKYPDLVHVEETSFFRPNFDELDQLWLDTPYDWRENYAVHLWYHNWSHRSGYRKTKGLHKAKITEEHSRFWSTEPTYENIRTWNGTFGQLARYVLYGSPDIIPANENAIIYHHVA